MTDLDLAGKHKYVTSPGGAPGINVTTVSGLLDDGKSGAMAGAAVRLTKTGYNYRAEWAAKRDAGTRVHAVCEDWLTGRESTVEDRDLGFVDALEKFWADHTPVRVECEAIALSQTHGYGGRFDMVATLRDGRTLLIDLKSGRSYPTETTLQLAAYRFCDGIGVYDASGMLTGVRPMPQVDGCACLYVRPDGAYDLIERKADEHAFSMFCRLLDVYKWMKETK